jgi:Carboxypeptidase regulatory-like domain
VLCRQFHFLSLILAIVVCVGKPTWAIPPSTPVTNSTDNVVVDKFTIFPCGLNLGNRQLLSSMLIRGQEDGEQAIDFANWSIPFKVLTQNLKFQSKSLPDGRLEVRSSTAVVIIDPQQLNSYPEIGLAIKIKDLQQYFGITAKFDVNEYTIKLTMPQAVGQNAGGANPTAQLDFTGLEAKNPEAFSLTAIEQKSSFSGNNNVNQSRLQTRVTGTALGASWYAQVSGNSNNLLDLKINDLQVVKYSDYSDYVFGGQSAFWNRQNSGNYWGATGIWRQGFTPKLSNNGNVNLSERNQANQVGRSVVGEAAPGTLVRLLPVGSNQPIDEVLVDSTGIFRFDNVPVTNGDRYYRLWLFANGQLSAAPEVREVNFVTVPGQLPVGATATLASLGVRRETGGLLGNFSDLRGAVVTRWGINEWLTVGSGVSLDQGVQGIGELYFQPNGVPLDAAISVRTGSQWDVLSKINWRPDPNLKLAWNLDRFSQRLRGDWKLSNQLSLNSTYNSSEALGIGFDYQARGGLGRYTAINASIDTNTQLRWRATQQLGAWELQNQGNESGTISNLTYKFDRYRSTENSLQLTYQTNQITANSDMATLLWRYRQTDKSPWEAEIGYGIGREGGGLIAGGAFNLLPGINLRGRYQTGGINSSSPSFSLEIVSNLETQNGLHENPQQLDKLRTHGGIEITPFFDANGNGKQDANEKSYLDLELININNRSVQIYRPQVINNRITFNVAPGKYQLDFDPSGFPVNWRTKSAGYAVEVAAGGYTQVLVPLVSSYNIEGMVTDPQGRPLVSAKIELVPINTGDRALSITSRDGKFYLESLSQGNYQLQVNGRSISTINLNSSSPSSQTLNLQLPN